ncbi:iron-only hydrogenase maturation protein HydF [Desulfonispora thiosulfatigenes DSM 11270]|uniref:Iron-only hydrogenase maturation protein HydF n=1 Tax=Desulfonispora thiosulfatigenes DSM 11270 TaxID=656914 RepID=A0A1W1VTJ5_DESTI|nr:[FeFe] hydrogenase H-cluster maturation GTPase HydF [Desulfonispora thiosulfatigenes]SMB96678.1 iron-only hydrogenase maturation protein HydF [Desulfonispora thiosulfatigenes DSM 11270]
MHKTPNANRKHIAIFGNTNAGKSSLLNAIIGQEISIVSEVRGTTTDIVSKAMEFGTVGPVVFIDTAGLNDTSNLGQLRVKKTLKVLERTDLALYVMDINDIDEVAYQEMIRLFKKYNIPHILVITKIDKIIEISNKDNVGEKLAETLDRRILEVKSKYKEAIFISTLNKERILTLKEEIIKKLSTKEEETLIGDLLPYGSKIILVVPIDSEAPKGRLILPQVQLIRDCLDHGIKSYVVRDTELKEALGDLKGIDLVVTDSQIFKSVKEIVPKEIKLTSFSILLSRQKGDINTFLEGIAKIKSLTKDSKVLISESCTHNETHEDIGRVKIPTLLNKHVGQTLNYDFKMGHDFPEDLEKYDLVIHCASCMLNKKTMQTRINICKEKGVKITNYGMVLAYLTGILDKSIEIFQ